MTKCVVLNCIYNTGTGYCQRLKCDYVEKEEIR